MPSPIYEAGVPVTHVRVRACNAEGQAYPGEMVKIPFAQVDTLECHGSVKRKPVFGREESLTISHLEVVFDGLKGNADWERISEETGERWVKLLDRCDQEGIDYETCDAYVDELMAMVDIITLECTGRSLVDNGVSHESLEIMSNTWKHAFVQFIWMRDLDWENLVKHLSDPNIGTHFEESYFQPDLDQALRFNMMTKLMAPLQAWNCALGTGAGGPGRRVGA